MTKMKDQPDNCYSTTPSSPANLTVDEHEYLSVMHGRDVHVRIIERKIHQLELYIATKEELLRYKNASIDELNKIKNDLVTQNETIFVNCVTFCPKCGKSVVYRGGIWYHIDKDGNIIDDSIAGHSLISIANNLAKIKKWNGLVQTIKT